MTPHHYDRQCRCDDCTQYERTLAVYVRRETIQSIIQLGKKLEWLTHSNLT
jgi:hypothetical protein